MNDNSQQLTEKNQTAPNEKAERNFRAVKEDYPQLRDFVLSFAGRYTDDRRKINDIELALGEVFSNIEFYSANDGKTVTELSVELLAESGTMSITFADNGKPFNPLENPEPSLEENIRNKVVGGFGIFMVRKLMDGVEYKYSKNKNILILKKKLVEESA